MTLYTVPDDLPIPEAGMVVRNLEDKFGDLATAVQVALARPGTVASAAERDAAWPAPTPGQTVWRTDMNWREMYLPAGRVAVAGWFPIDGALPFVKYFRNAAFNWGTTAGGAVFNFDTLKAGSATIGLKYGTGVFTITQAGRWRLRSQIGVTSGATSTYANVYVKVNGTTVEGAQGALAGATSTVATAFDGVLQVNDTIAVATRAATAIAGVAVNDSAQLTLATLEYVGPA